MALHVPNRSITRRRRTPTKRGTCVQSVVCTPQNKKQCKKTDHHPVREDDDHLVVALSDLPDHVVYLILVLLPVSVLVRLLCLSKQWSSVIQSRSFSMDHLLKTMQLSPQEQEHELQTSVIFRIMPNLETHKSCASLVKFCGDQHGEVHRDILSLKFPVCPCSDIWMSTYSYDGIFCLIYERHHSMTQIILWNPITGRYREVPWPSDVLERYYGVRIFVGFGYDPTISDYKIVMVCFASYNSERNVIKVRPLKSNVWTTVQASTTSCNMIREYGMLEPVGVGEDLYWIGNNIVDRSPVILKFNVVEEKLTTILFPQLDMDKRISGKLGQFNGSLHAYIYGSFRDDDQKLVEVWKHSNQGNKSDWEKLLIITKESMPRNIALVDSLELLGFTRNGNFLINVDNVLLVYVPHDNICVEIKINEDILPKKPINCQIHLLDTETMISP